MLEIHRPRTPYKPSKLKLVKYKLVKFKYQMNDEVDEKVLHVLTSLIAHKNRADAKGWRDAFENMPVYLQVCAHASSAIHVVIACSC